MVVPHWCNDKVEMFRSVVKDEYAKLMCEEEMCTLVNDIHTANPAHFVTANTDEFVRDLLRRSLVADRIGTIIGNRTAGSKTQKLRMIGIDPKEIVWITDTSSDVHYGQEANVGMIIGTAFNWSVHGKTILKADYPDLEIANTPKELHDILKEIAY